MKSQKTEPCDEQIVQGGVAWCVQLYFKALCASLAALCTAVLHIAQYNGLHTCMLLPSMQVHHPFIQKVPPTSNMEHKPMRPGLLRYAS